MKRYFHTAALALLSIGATNLCAQNLELKNENEEFSQRVFSSFASFYQTAINEKIYIQTDKPYYSAGDDIWIKGYLLNSITHEERSASKFIYVELVDARDSLYRRIKIKEDEFGFHNNITLPNDVPAGDYTLTAYTHWMMNWGDEYFYHRKLHIANPLDVAVNVSTTYSRDKNNDIVANIKITTNSVAKVDGDLVTCVYTAGGRERKSRMKVGEGGEMELTLPASMTSTNFDIISEDNKINFKKSIYVPSLEDNLDVQFMPESGSLMAGELQTVAFKAIGVDGLSRNIEGVVYGEKAGEVAYLKSSFKGMGRMSLITDAADDYYAMVNDVNTPDVKYRVELPKPVTSGCTIKASVSGDYVIYQIVSTNDIDYTKVGTVIHSRGRVVTARLLSKANEVVRVPISQLPDGILSIALIDTSDNTPIAERLVFIPQKDVTTTITSNKSRYAARSLVELDIEIADNEVPVEGNFALSVTDSNSVDLSKFGETIVSNLLLSSDLSGYVEDAADYFTDNAAKDRYNVDLLMLTSGWRRFSLGDVLSDLVAAPEIQAETTQVISGYLKGFFGNDARKGRLMLMCEKLHIYEDIKLEDNSRFNLTYEDFPDSTTMHIQAIHRSGSDSALSLYINPEIFPDTRYIYKQPLVNQVKKVVPDAYLAQTTEDYYNNGGMAVIDLDAITVVAEEPERTVMYGASPSYSMSETMSEIFADRTVMDLLRTYPNVTVVDSDSVTVNNNGVTGTPIFYVDEIEVDADFALTLEISFISSLDLITGTETIMFGMEGNQGVILITLKDPSLFDNARQSSSLAAVTHLGYKAPDEFYQPKYEVAENYKSDLPDLRTTLYWDPFVKISSNGRAKVSFYTADRASTYNIVLEGITTGGKAVRHESSIERQ